MSEIRVMRQLDKEAVRRIFDNILSNAARYSDGDLAISLSADGRIQFSNHAAKLSSVEVEKLFERFYTVESSRNSTGIGLSIARQLPKCLKKNSERIFLSQRENLCKRFGEVVRWEWLKLHDTLQVLAIHSLG